MILSRRRLFEMFGVGAAAAAVSTLPTPSAPAPVPCDADWVEAEWAAGRDVINQNITLRRSVKMPADTALLGCRVFLGAGFASLTLGDDCQVMSNIFETARTLSKPLLAAEAGGPIPNHYRLSA